MIAEFDITRVITEGHCPHFNYTPIVNCRRGPGGKRVVVPVRDLDETARVPFQNSILPTLENDELFRVISLRATARNGKTRETVRLAEIDR